MDETYSAFLGPRRLASGDLRAVLSCVKAQSETTEPLVIFDDRLGSAVDFDLRGDLEDVLARVRPASPAPARGRPKLGVVAREVTLLPRHWDWLEAQPGGASAALRRLVEEARRLQPGRERLRAAQGAADRFMQVLAGDRPGYQEAARALYARDPAAFEAHTADWPEDVRAHARQLAAPAFEAAGEAG